MDRWILTAICLAGLGLAGAMAWRWRNLDRLDHSTEQTPTGWLAVRRALRSIAVAVNSGVIAGALVGGFGGRLFMRIMAATSDDAVQGTLTNADEPIGRVSVGGTISLILFGGVFGGLLVAALYRALRPWLPAPAWRAGAVTGVMALGAFGAVSELLARDNPDFEILSPTPLAAVLVVVGALFLSTVLVTVYERLDRGMADVDRWSIGLVAFVPVLLILLTVVAVPVLLVVLLVSALAPGVVRWWTTSSAVARVGRVLVWLAAAVSAVIAATEIVAITT